MYTQSPLHADGKKVEDSPAKLREKKEKEKEKWVYKTDSMVLYLTNSYKFWKILC